MIVKFDKYLFALSLFASFLNVCYMHASVGSFDLKIDRIWDITRFFSFLGPCLIDFFFISIIAFVIFYKRSKLFLGFLFLSTFLLSISNIIYSRFFSSYMFIDSLVEFYKRAGDGFFGQFVSDAFQFTDLFYVIAFLFFIPYLLFHANDTLHFIKIWIVLVSYLFSFFIVPLWDLVDSKFRNESPVVKGYFDKESIVNHYAWRPKDLCETYGVTSVYMISRYIGDKLTLSSQEKQEIIDFISRQNKNNECQSDLHIFDKGKNYIFILVESFLSSVVDLVIDGVEIMPNLNNLKKSSNVYYNGSVNSNIALGESGDGQFVYMTGLLPIRTGYVVSIVNNDNCIGLPYRFKNEGYSTMVTIPSLPEEWNQRKVSSVYGFDILNSSRDLGITTSSYICDSLLFNLAILKEQNLMEEPFMHMILTSEMHVPYDTQYYDCIDLNWPNTINDEYKIYLSKCINTDKAIGKYLDSLKERGLYDNSVIVIAADHYAHARFLKMKRSEINNEYAPLFIVNSSISKESFYDGEINQLDLYPTILSMFELSNVENSFTFTGLGCSIFNKDSFIPSVCEKTWEISNKIIRSDFLSKIN